MYQTILFKAPGRRSNSPVVILNALSMQRRSSSDMSRLLRLLADAGRAVAGACHRPRRIVQALFGGRAIVAAMTLSCAAMLWHIVSIADTIEAQRATAVDGMLLMPWLIAGAIRVTMADRKAAAQKGGKA